MDHEEECIIKRMICFLPDDCLTGNFFRQVWNILFYKINITSSYYLEEERMQCDFYAIPVLYTKCKFLRFFQNVCTILIEHKKEKFVRKQSESKLVVYEMSDPYDYPKELNYHFARKFLQSCEYQAKTKVAIITGRFLETRQLVTCIEPWIAQWNALTFYVVDKSQKAMLLNELESFVEDIEEEYGLVIQITDRMKELVEAEVILDCSDQAIKIKSPVKPGTKYFMLDGSIKKARNMRRISGKIQVDSIAKCLDRAFQNKL